MKWTYAVPNIRLCLIVDIGWPRKNEWLKLASWETRESRWLEAVCFVLFCFFEAVCFIFEFSFSDKKNLKREDKRLFLRNQYY